MEYQKKMNLQEAEKHLLYRVIAGSKAYGLDLPTSDTDIRGVYLQPNEFRLGFGYKEQVNDTKNDIVYYELNRFVELLAKNNPTILENLFVPEDRILFIDDRFKVLYDRRNEFITKKCKMTFGGYAISQIKKARGLNKKIVNPVAKTKKTPLDFCYIIDKDTGYTMLAKQWLKKQGKDQQFCGLAELPNGVQMYKLYYDYLAETKNDNPKYSNLATYKYRGIIDNDSDDVRHSEIPTFAVLDAFLFYNKDGYSSYCKDYREYWEWMEKRNKTRYSDTQKHGKGYDGKNLMHCLRMLDMAIEIAEGKGVNLIRPNKEWLLSVRRGEANYDEVIKLVEEKKLLMDTAFDKSDLPDDIDKSLTHKLILEIRNTR